jgi:hypothetical protein
MKKIALLSGILLFLLPVKNFAQNSSPPLARGEQKFSNKPKLVRGPYLQVATDTSMVVRWRTDAAVRSRVRFGTSPESLDNFVDDIS